jgi:DNA topoisomerase-3
VVEKSTKPPKAFTDATLIRAMCNVAKFVADPKARQILRDTDGIGTPATRAAIIETLFARGYVLRQKKQIRSTAVGRALIDALPVVATTPDQTAVWEAALRRVHDQQLELERFLGAVSGQLGELVARGQAAGPLTVPVATSRAPTRARPRVNAQERTRKRARRPRSAAGRASP